VRALVRPEPIAGGLRLTAPGRSSIEVARPAATDSVTGSLIGVEVEVGDAGAGAAAWFSELLGTDVRLVATTPASQLTLPEGLDVFDQPIAFGDLAPVLVSNTASLEWLVGQSSEPFGMDRFRPYLVVETTEPFAEDTWALFRLGQAELRHGTAWPRCFIPQIDQATGERHPEPAKVLRAHRWCLSAPGLPPLLRSVVEGSAVFGAGCAIGPAGAQIAVGDRLTVEATTPPLVAPPT
jgi:uncharacterized protein YcbX